MRFPRWLFCVLLTAVPGFAQGGSVAAPLIGFAFDRPAAAIRPIRGIPGASLLGLPVDTGFPVAMAAISPRQDFALALAADDSRLRLVSLPAGIDAGSLPEGALPAPAQIRFSPSGTAALLFQEPGRLQALSGLPARAALREIDLSALSPAPTAMSVTDDGALVVIAGPDAVWVVNAEGIPIQLALPGATTALSFRRESHDLVAVSATGDVHLVRHPETNPEYRLIYAASEQTAGPVAAQFSASGAYAYTVNQGGNIATIDVETGVKSEISCNCRASALDPMNSRNLFRLTSPGRSEAGQTVLMLFDGSGAEARVWFVPPGGSPRETEGSVQ